VGKKDKKEKKVGDRESDTPRGEGGGFNFPGGNFCAGKRVYCLRRRGEKGSWEPAAMGSLFLLGGKLYKEGEGREKNYGTSGQDKMKKSPAGRFKGSFHRKRYREGRGVEGNVLILGKKRRGAPEVANKNQEMVRRRVHESWWSKGALVRVGKEALLRKDRWARMPEKSIVKKEALVRIRLAKSLDQKPNEGRGGARLSGEEEIEGEAEGGERYWWAGGKSP